MAPVPRAITAAASTEPLASADAAEGRGRIAGGEGDDVAQALVVALGLVVLHELAQHGAQMTFAKGNDVPEAIVPDRPNEPLGVGVQVWAPRRQAQQLYARDLQQGPEVRRIERIPIDDEVGVRRKKTLILYGPDNKPLKTIIVDADGQVSETDTSSD